MTVSQLIEKLKTIEDPDNVIVMRDDNDNGDGEVVASACLGLAIYSRYNCVVFGTQSEFSERDPKDTIKSEKAILII